MFGSSTGGSGFGGFGQQQNNQQTGQSGGLFGQSQPAQTNTPSFGGFGSAQPSQMPTFGSNTSNTGAGGLFGQSQQQQQQQQQPSLGFSFGQNTNTTNQPFGQNMQNNQPKPAGFGGFGASTTGAPSSFGGFGANQAQQPAFGSSSTSGTSPFGAKPTGGLFGQQQPQQTGAFGQPAPAGGLFGGGGNLSAQQTGGMPTQGTSNPPYQAFINTEKDTTGAGSTTYQYNTITCSPAYRAASIEELRLQDYQQGRKTGNVGPTTSGFGQNTGTNAFGTGNTGGSLFGQAQQSTGGFGANASGGGLFGQNNQQPQQQSSSLFGSSTNTNTAAGGLFGQPAQQQGGGGLFGQSNQQQQQGSTGFTFGQSQPANNTASSGFTFGQNNQQQNKPGGLFGGGTAGGFGSTSTQPASTGFSFGGNAATAQQSQSGGLGGTTSSGGFGFGASTTANQSKPGGLFGTTTSAPTFGGFGATSTATSTDANKPAFSFGGAGGTGGFGSTSAAPGQTTTAAPTGGLFGNQQNTTAGQPSSGFSFGTAGTNNTQGGLVGGTNSTFSFGGSQPQQQGTNNAGLGGGTSLFGQNKPATGGLFGSSQPQQQPQQPGTFSFGGSNNAGGGLFGGGAKPATGGLFGSNTSGAAQTGQGGGLFGNSIMGGNQQSTGTTGGLFGGGSGQNASGGLFGSTQNTNNAASGGNNLFGGSSTLGGANSFGGGQSTGSLFGQSQMQQSVGSNLQTSLNANPYGTDSLFGGAAASVAGSLSSNPDKAAFSNSHVMLPFNVAKPSVKKQPPLVPPFRPSPRSSSRVTKLRGSTPGAMRESTPVREGTPSLFASANATNRSITSSSTGSHLFRGLSDDLARSQREVSVPSSLPSQAFVGRTSVKRLVLDDQTNKTVNVSNSHGRSRSLFGATRGSSVASEQNGVIQPQSLFDRSSTAAASPRPISFSPALETATSSRSRPAIGNVTSELGDDSSFGQSAFGSRRNLGGYTDSPSKGVEKTFEESLPSLHSGITISRNAKVNKEDALLPLDYYTVPSLSELREWSHAELRSVESFVVGRKGFGSVEFVEPVDLTTVGELNNIPGGIVQLRKKECFVYPDEEDCFDPETGNERDGVQPDYDPKRVPGGGKASRGEGLNVPALVNLEGCWPLDRSNRQPIKDIEHPRVKQMLNKLRRRSDLEFKNYEPISGTWTFKVEHFSRYGLDGEDEDEERGVEDPKDKSKNTKVKVLDKKQTESRDAKNQNTIEDEEIPHATQDRRTGVGRSLTSANQQPASNSGSQPWAATLGLEAQRMQVMQASFFGGAAVEQKAVPSNLKSIRGKESRPASQSVEPKMTNTGSRTTFGTPMRVENASGEQKTSQVDPEHSQPITMEFAPLLTGRPRKITRIAVEKSVADDGHGIILDAGLAMGRSFRVGWGPHGTFVHRSKVIDTSVKSFTDDQSESLSVVKMGRLQIFEPEEERNGSELIIEMLKIQLENSIIELRSDSLMQDEEEDGVLPCPIAFPGPDLRFKHFLSLASSPAADQNSQQKRFESAIFRLGSALFDEIDLKLPKAADESLRAQALRMRRRQNLSEWIRWYVEHSIRTEIRSQIASPDRQSGEKIIFSLLSGGYLEEACKQAMEMGNFRLATLLAQANGGGNDDEFRLDLLDQLNLWRAAGADVFISTEYRKILEILSGNVLIGKGNGKRHETGERVEDIGISAGLDWVRTFALFLYYDAHFEDSIDESILSYESCIGKGMNDHIIVPPLPPYLEKDFKCGSKQLRDLVRDSSSYPKDILFGLLKLYSQPDFPLEEILDPHQYGPSPLNFSIAFHVAQILCRVLGIRDFSDRIDLGVEGEAIANEFNWRGNSASHDNLCIHFAMQLESMNLWTWAAFILLHLEMPQSRKANIVSLLSRNVDQFADIGNDLIQSSERSQADFKVSDDIKFVTEKLRIPIEWIFEVLANAAGNRKERFAQFKFLLRARLFSKAHSIAVIYLAPESIIRHDFTLIMELFTPFRKSVMATSRNAQEEADEEGNHQDGTDQINISGWQAGGQTYLDYIAICRSLPWLVGTHAANVVNAMESIYAEEGNEDIDFQKSLRIISSSYGPEIAVAIGKIDRIASRIPTVLQRIDELFDSFVGAKGDQTTIMVARKQMIQSVHNCIRSLKATKTLAKLVDFIPSLNVDLNTMAYEETRLADSDVAPASQIEIENLQFMANAYCSAMVESSA